MVRMARDDDRQCSLYVHTTALQRDLSKEGWVAAACHERKGHRAMPCSSCKDVFCASMQGAF